MKRFLLDANIYISAILFGGKPKEIINFARNGKFEIVLSEYILWEIRKVLSQKFKIPEAVLNTIEHDILSLAKLVKVHSLPGQISRDPADDAVLAAAVDGRADAVVSGDKDLLDLKKYKNISILSPDRFIRKYRNL